MNVVLLHNDSAGEGERTTKQLVREIEQSDHTVLHVMGDAEGLASVLKDPALKSCDLVVAAGGDGTVDKAAVALVGSGVALTVLPLGTANNIARALGVLPAADADDGLVELMRSWRKFRRRPIDAASVRHLSNEEAEPQLFLEAFGVGAFPDVIRRAKKLPPPSSRAETLARDLALHLTTVAEAPLRDVSVRAWSSSSPPAGDDLSGAYLMVEVLNIPFIGPGLAVAPDADAGDGLLDLLLVGEAERAALLAAIAATMRGENVPLQLPTHRASRLSLRHRDPHHHHDGKHKTADDECDVEVAVVPGAVSVLAP